VALISDPRDIEYMLKTNFTNYVKGHKFAAIFGDVLGQGIFATDGHPWLVCNFFFFFFNGIFLTVNVVAHTQLQRKLASHEFSTKRFRTFQMDVRNFLALFFTRILVLIFFLIFDNVAPLPGL
jgi:hypothetical protein